MGWAAAAAAGEAVRADGLGEVSAFFFVLFLSLMSPLLFVRGTEVSGGRQGRRTDGWDVGTGRRTAVMG